MQNHVHGIINIVENDKNNMVDTGMKNIDIGMNIVVANDLDVGAKDISPLQPTQPNTINFHSPSKTIGSIIRGFKIGVTKWFRKNTEIYNVWQWNYYEHIIRGENELNRIRNYIINNPLKWQNDKYNN